MEFGTFNRKPQTSSKRVGGKKKILDKNLGAKKPWFGGFVRPGIVHKKAKLRRTIKLRAKKGGEVPIPHRGPIQE